MHRVHTTYAKHPGRAVWSHVRAGSCSSKDSRPNDLDGPGLPALFVLVASNRPLVHAFVAEHTRKLAPRIGVIAMPLDQDALENYTPQLDRATAALVDIGSDPDGGVRFCAALRSRRTDLRVVAVVCCPKPTLASHIQQLMLCGVHDILDTEAGPAEILAALEAEDLGSQGMHMQLHRSYGPLVAEGQHLDLDAGERQLLELNTAGLSIREIGAVLNLCERAVGHHLDHLRLKLGVRNRQELAAWGGAHGLYQPIPATHEPPGSPAEPDLG